MPDRPRLDRKADPWLPARLRHDAALVRAELAADDAVTAALVEALAEARRRVLHVAQPAAVTAAAVPPDLAGLAAARDVWVAALGELLRPVLEAVFSDRWRAVYAQAVDREPDEVVARLAHLAEVPNRLVEPYWRDQLARISSTVDEAFDAMRAELVAGQAAGESIDQLRDRVGRVLQLDAGTQAIRDRIGRLEARLVNGSLTDDARAALWRQRDDALQDLFVVRGREARARAKLRLAEIAERRGDVARADQMRREARRLFPTPGALQQVEARLARVDSKLFVNPDLEEAERAALAAERADLYEQLRTGEDGWHAKARRIARTETLGAMNAGTLAAAKAVADAGGAIQHKQWLSTNDERTRASHQVAEGQVQPVGSPFIVGGHPLMHPGDPLGPPEEVIHCRCTVLLLDAEEASAYDAAAPAPAALTAAQEATMTDTPERLPNGWRGVLAPLDTRSGDDRIIGHPAELRLRTPPLPFLHQQATADRHDNSVVVSRVDRAWIEGDRLMGEGPYDLSSEAGREAARSLALGYANGVSVDLDDAVFEVRYIDANGQTVTAPEPDDEAAVDQMLAQLMEGSLREVAYARDWRLMGATQVAHPAFDEARIEPVYDYVPAATPPVQAPALAASAVPLLAAGVAFAAADFADPKLAGPTAITVDDDGRVFGHLATWGVCHTGFDVCVTAPSSVTGYAYFHVGEVATDTGPIAVGKITLGGGHADPRAGVRGAIEHYDDAGAAVAVVRAGEDEHGVWVAGRILPGVTDEQVARLRMSPLSGDWRRVNGNLELVAALAVNVPGFPVPRAVAASAAGRQTSLVAAGALAPHIGNAGAALESRIVARVLAEINAHTDRARRAELIARRIRRDPASRVDQLAARLGRTVNHLDTNGRT